MSATCVPWYVPRSNTSLCKHGNLVFPHFCPLNQNLARVRTRGTGGRGGWLFFFSVDPRPVAGGLVITAQSSSVECQPPSVNRQQPSEREQPPVLTAALHTVLWLSAPRLHIVPAQWPGFPFKARVSGLLAPPAPPAPAVSTLQTSLSWETLCVRHCRRRHGRDAKRRKQHFGAEDNCRTVHSLTYGKCFPPRAWDKVRHLFPKTHTSAYTRRYQSAHLLRPHGKPPPPPSPGHPPHFTVWE